MEDQQSSGDDDGQQPQSSGDSGYSGDSSGSSGGDGNTYPLPSEQKQLELDQEEQDSNE